MEYTIVTLIVMASTVGLYYSWRALTKSSKPNNRDNIQLGTGTLYVNPQPVSFKSTRQNGVRVHNTGGVKPNPMAKKPDPATKASYASNREARRAEQNTPSSCVFNDVLYWNTVINAAEDQKPSHSGHNHNDHNSSSDCSGSHNSHSHHSYNDHSHHSSYSDHSSSHSSHDSGSSSSDSGGDW